MARCSNCAFNEFCPDFGIVGTCDSYFSKRNLTEVKGDCCMECRHFCLNSYTCALDSEAGILSIHYCCDKFGRR